MNDFFMFSFRFLFAEKSFTVFADSKKPRNWEKGHEGGERNNRKEIEEEIFIKHTKIKFCDVG